MALYPNQAGKLNEVKGKPFKLERDIQKFFEQNLSVVMGLELVQLALRSAESKISISSVITLQHSIIFSPYYLYTPILCFVTYWLHDYILIDMENVNAVLLRTFLSKIL
jgi:hypothetical protein